MKQSTRFDSIRTNTGLALACLSFLPLGACGDPCLGTAQGPERDQCEAEQKAKNDKEAAEQKTQDDKEAAEQKAKDDKANATRCGGKNLTIAGTITHDTTWTSGSLCVFSGVVTVAEGVTLTIEEGVTVKSGQGGYYNHWPLVVQGDLQVEGSESDPVVFTSFRDDTTMGDTNGDEGASAPGLSNWGGIQFAPDSTGNVQFAEVRYAGSAFYTDDASPTLDNIRVKNSQEAFSALPKDQLKVTNFVGQGNAWNGLVRRPGTIDRDTTWDQSDVVHIFAGKITVAESASLSIHAGVVIKSGESGYYNHWPLIVEGDLQVEGSESDPVVFTSFRDDSKMGDTNGDEGASTAGPTNWGGVQFTPGSTGNVQFAEVRYAGTAFYTDDASPTFDNIRVKNSQEALSALPKDQLKVTNFEGQGNAWNGLVRRPGTIDRDTTWDQSDVVHIFAGNITVAQGASLSIHAGVVIKSGESGYYNHWPLIVEGDLQVEGSESDPVVFTSFRDDTNMGDTNGDEGASKAGPSNWGGIRFTPDSTGALSFTKIRYSGTAISVDSSSPIATNILFEGNDIGFAASGEGATPQVHHSCFIANATGASVVNSAELDATENYWDSKTGPSGKDLAGSGQIVTPGVSHELYLATCPL